MFGAKLPKEVSPPDPGQVSRDRWQESSEAREASEARRLAAAARILEKLVGYFSCPLLWCVAGVVNCFPQQHEILEDLGGQSQCPLLGAWQAW